MITDGKAEKIKRAISDYVATRVDTSNDQAVARWCDKRSKDIAREYGVCKLESQEDRATHLMEWAQTLKNDAHHHRQGPALKTASMEKLMDEIVSILTDGELGYSDK